MVLLGGPGMVCPGGHGMVYGISWQGMGWYIVWPCGMT